MSLYEVRCLGCARLVNVKDGDLYSGWCDCKGTRGMHGSDRILVRRGCIMVVGERKVTSIPPSVLRRSNLNNMIRELGGSEPIPDGIIYVEDEYSQKAISCDNQE